MKPFEFVDPRSAAFVEPSWRGELPHLYKAGCSYFVTFRLWDAIVRKKQQASAAAGTEKRSRAAGGTPAPQRAASDICGAVLGGARAPQEAAGGICGAGVPPAVPTRFRKAEDIAALSEPPLRLGSCFLENPQIAVLVQGALRHFDQQRYVLAAWCIMPNHVHAVLAPLPGHSPLEILHSWKSFTSHEANKILRRRGAFWERESFDHLVRSVEDFERFVKYVEENPVVAGLCKSPEEWPWSSASSSQRAGRV